MHYIFIDIASHNGLIACVNEKGVIALREVSTRIRDHELIPLVEECLKESGWEYSDLARIACVTGPGGFTSLRIAVAFANTLMDQLGIEGVGVGLWEMYGVRIREIQNSKFKIQNSDVLWIHATKRDLLFVRGFGNLENLWPEPALVSLDDFKKKCPSGSLWMGELLDEQKEGLKELHLQEAELKPAVEILPEFVSGLNYGKKPLEPWYGR